MGPPLNSHENFIGKSPLVNRHCTLEESAKFDGSSPNMKGTILGGTADDKCMWMGEGENPNNDIKNIKMYTIF